MKVAINSAGVNTAIEAFKETYERLVKDGIEPRLIVIAMSEIIAYCLANSKGLSGGSEASYRLWLRAFEVAYQAKLRKLRAGSES